jgi:hypothetical protein
MWQSPEMKVIWDRIDNMLKESNGIYPQPSGMWERDYDVVLEELSAEERKIEERRQKDEELQERLKVLSTDGGWKGVVESFRQRGCSNRTKQKRDIYYSCSHKNRNGV